jgi:hypothetical protein
MSLYEITLSSMQIYVVDTVGKRYWPQGYPKQSSTLWPRMDPTDPEFIGKIIRQVKP